MRFISGMREVADAFDGFVVDLWGVIHDGVHALPGAPACLAELRRRGKRIVLLSNAPRRSRLVVTQLQGLGVDETLYDQVVTSGEITRALLVAWTDPFLAGVGRRLFHLGPPRDANVLEGVEASVVPTLAEADLLLNTGPDDERPAAEAHYRPLLEEARALDLPMLCANPDLVIVRGGEHIICAGLLARTYASLGGRVKLIGKPDPVVYGPVVEALGGGRVCAVGDALATDIAGAKAAGLPSVWVLGGIHQHLVSDREAAENEAKAAGLSPDAALPHFHW